MGEASWVIHKQWSGETSARVLFFTRDRGLVYALCKGGRLPKKQSLLQAFTPLWVCFHEKNTMYFVQKIEIIPPSFALDGMRLMAGLYVNELIYYALQPNDACSLLFDSYEQLLQLLATSSDVIAMSQHLRNFEKMLITEMGYSFSLTHDADQGMQILPDIQYVFNPDRGFIQSSHGILGEYILSWADQNWSHPKTRQIAKIVMRAAIDHALGGKPLLTRTISGVQ